MYKSLKVFIAYKGCGVVVGHMHRDLSCTTFCSQLHHLHHSAAFIYLESLMYGARRIILLLATLDCFPLSLH